VLGGRGEIIYVSLIKVLEKLKISYVSLDLFLISCCFERLIVNKAMIGDIIKQIIYINPINA